MGCSLEYYRSRIGTFGNAFKGKAIGKEGTLTRGKSDLNTSKFLLFYIAWYSLNIVLTPLLLSVSAAARDRGGPPYRCTAGVHLPGRTPPSPSPPYRTPPLPSPPYRTPPSPSPPYRTPPSRSPPYSTPPSPSPPYIPSPSSSPPYSTPPSPSPPYSI